MRIDYLKAGRGELFTATASLLRVGKQICVTRMELHNEKQKLHFLAKLTTLKH